MKTTDLKKYNDLILRFFFGLTVLFWGYEKLMVEKLTAAYTLDYGKFMLVDVQAFLQVAGWAQIIMGVCLMIGLLTRIQAAIGFIMGLVTIVIPGFIILQDVPHFAYAFAFTGGSLVLLLNGSDEFSLDALLRNRKLNQPPNVGVQTARINVRSK